MEPVVVSVVMAAYNSERFIGAAIESILGQTYQKFELLIIEDGSTDGTLAVIRSYTDKRIRVLMNEKNAGTLYSVRRGVAEARGKYIAILDSDDISEPERLRKQVLVLEHKHEVLLCASKAKNLVNGRLEKIQYLPVKNPRQLRFTLLFGNSVAHSSVMFRKNELQKLGIQYEKYGYCHDYHLIMSVGLISPIYLIDEELIQYRIHGKQKTSVLSRQKIDREVNSAREEYIRNIEGLTVTERDLLCHAVWGTVKNLRDFRKLKSAVFHYARLCHLQSEADRDLIQYEFYRMFEEQEHTLRWHIYFILQFYRKAGSAGKDQWNKFW